MNQDIVKQYVESLPSGEEYKLVIMDYFTVYKNKEVLKKLEAKNYIPAFVTGGYTDLLQPLDAALMKPFKSRVRNYYNDWLDSVEIGNHKVPVPKKHQIVEWIRQSLETLPAEQIARAFPAAHIEIPDVTEYMENPFFQYFQHSNSTQSDKEKIWKNKETTRNRRGKKY